MPRRWGVLLGVGLGLALAVTPMTSIAEPQTVAEVGTPTEGIELIALDVLSPRLSSLTFFSASLQRHVQARVLTPEGFDPSRDHLPVLWLLHGGFGSNRDWTAAGNAEAFTAGLPMIVVMPDAGIGGWYTDWNRTPGEGPERWETFHLRELRPFIETVYQTRTDRNGRGVAGLSMGGFGAMTYATRHPDLFGFAASFSGAVDIVYAGVAAVVTISPLAHQGLPGDIFGEYLVNESMWRAHNPVDLAANLRTVAVQLRTGNGQPGPYNGGYDPQENGVGYATTTLHQRLDALGIPHFFDYGPGAHRWEYWAEDLQATLPAVVEFFAAPPAQPVPAVDHLAFEPAFSAWGFDVTLNRTVLESTVLSIGPDGFDLTGTGSGQVTTPAQYQPGEVVHATIEEGGVTRTIDLAAGPDGRLVVPVSLGPPSLVAEYPLARALSFPKRTSQVRLWKG